MSQFALPAGLNFTNNLAPGVPGLRRYVKNMTTSQNSYRPGETAIIPLSTGDAGAFWIKDTVRLKFQLDILNYSAFIDFINLGPAGFHQIIKKMSLDINGYEHELNDYYNWYVTTKMISRGENIVPFEVCRSNTWEPAGGLAGIKHINFIKPSMVTQTGLPHGVVFPPLEANGSNAVPDTFTETLMYYSNPYAVMSYGTTREPYFWSDGSTDVTKPPYFIDKFGQFQSSNWLEGGINWYSDYVEAPKHIETKYEYSNDGNSDTLPYGRAGASSTVTGSSIGLDHVLSIKRLLPGSTNSTTDPVGTYNNELVTGFETNEKGMYNRFIGGLNRDTIGYACKIRRKGAKDIGNVAFAQSVASFSPLCWPIKQPVNLEKLKKEYKESIVGVNQHNVLSYFANCKNIPIAKPIRLDSNDMLNFGENIFWGNHDFKDKHQTENKSWMNPSVAEITSFFVELKIYSSIIGEDAKVWFPETIFQQGTVKLKITFEDPNIAFQVLSDPCRVVPGTVRDRFPNLGIIESRKTTHNGTDLTTQLISIGSLKEVHPSALISGIHPIMISDYTPGDCFNDAVALGKLMVPNLKLDFLHNLDHLYQTIQLGANNANNTASPNLYVTNIRNTPFTSNANNIDQTHFYSGEISSGGGGDPGTSAIQSVPRDFLHVSSLISGIVNNLENNARIGLAPVKYSSYSALGQPSPDSFPQKYNPNSKQDFWNLQVYDLQNYARPSQHIGWLNNGISTASNGQVIASQYDAQSASTVNSNQNSYYYLLKNQDVLYQVPNWIPYAPPQCQYLPINNPYDKRTARTYSLDNIINENAVYYGTHLTSSKAQVRRTTDRAYPLGARDAGFEVGLMNKLTYVVKGIYVDYQQITLPPEDAANIIESALTSGVTIEVETSKLTTFVPAQSEILNQLVNITCAYCKNMSLWFTPRDCYQGDIAYSYNTFNSFYNPFASFDYKETSAELEQYNHLGGTPVYKNALRYNNTMGIELQVQVGAEYFPRVPINRWNELIQYTRWGDQKFGNLQDLDYMNIFPAIQPSYMLDQGFEVNCLQDGYTAVFLPLRCLDDQSITCNPSFITVELSIGGTLSAESTGYKLTSEPIIRGRRHPKGSLPFLKPLEGSFHLAFNFETYPGKGDEILTGIPITNNNFFLRMQKAHLLTQQEVRVFVKADCNGKLVVGRGSTASFLT